MKPKFYLLLTLLFLFLTSYLLAQDETKTKVFYGYGEVKWGSSFETVKSKYPNLIQSEPIDKGSVRYEQINSNKLIIRRSFSFYNNKLYKVYVEFNTDLDFTTLEAILKKLFLNFGPEHQKEEKKDILNNHYISGNTYYWWFYDEKMYIDVKLWDFKNAAGYNVESIFATLYINQAIKSELDKSQLKKISDDLEDI